MIVPFQVSCGSCDMCRRGFTNACESVPAGSAFGLGAHGGIGFGGAFADRVRVPYADHMLIERAVRSTAPGRRVFDVASFARMCVPIDDDVNASRFGWSGQDRPGRLRLVADAYGLDTDTRVDLLTMLDRAIEKGGEFVRRRVEAGEPGFVKMWEEMGGAERFDRRRRWWTDNRSSFEAALR